MARQGNGGRWTAEQARSVLAAWEQSGQSGTTYARSIGVVPQRLFWWRRRLDETRAQMGAKPALVPVSVRGTPVSVGSAPVVVTTATGVRIEVNDIDATTAAWIVAVLGGEDRT